MWKEDFYMNSMKGFFLAGLLIWSLLICPACANLDPSVAKEYRDAGADLLKYDPQIQSLSNLDKAKYAFEAYCNWLESNNIPVNSDLLGRAKNMGADWTCADHGLKLQEFFEGAAITAPHIFVKAISDSLNPLNVNSDHGALAIIDGGQVYFFDPWQLAVQNEKDGLTAYSEAKGSKWNGMTASDWETEMGKQDYRRFSFSDGGVEEKSLHKLLMDSKLIGTIVWGIKRPFPNSENGTIGEVYSFSIHTNVKGIPKDAKLDWSYGDGGADTGKKLDEVVTHKYDSAGTYTVHVIASWLGVWSTETTTKITIEDSSKSGSSSKGCENINYSKLKKVENPYLVYFVDSDGKYWGIFKGYYDTDRKKLKTEGCYIDSLKNGNWIEYYEKGNRKSEMNYINATEDGRFIEYYENGMKSREGYLKGIKWTGHWVWYQYPNGTKAEEVDYIEGNRTGHYIKYDKNGQKYNEGDYENDKKNGSWIWYNYDDGSIQFQANYRNGQWVSGDTIPDWA